MRERFASRTPFPSLLSLALGLLCAGIATAATTTTPFQFAYMYGTSGPASGGTPVNLVGNQFQPGASVTIGGIAVGASVTSSTRIGATSPGRTAGALYDVIITNPGDAPAVLTKGWFADFTDVPQASPFHAPVETIIRDGITSGCGGGNYCPSSLVTRAQMAVFLLRAGHGSSYVPPPATGNVFGDVPAGAPAAAFIEELSLQGISAGCGGGNYCPSAALTRAAMAVLVLKTRHGSDYTPPPATGTVFADVPADAFAADWIEQLFAEGITAGCGFGNFCPNASLSRAQAAALVVRAFGLS